MIGAAIILFVLVILLLVFLVVRQTKMYDYTAQLLSVSASLVEALARRNKMHGENLKDLEIMRRARAVGVTVPDWYEPLK